MQRKLLIIVAMFLLNYPVLFGQIPGSTETYKFSMMSKSVNNMETLLKPESDITDADNRRSEFKFTGLLSVTKIQSGTDSAFYSGEIIPFSTIIQTDNAFGFQDMDSSYLKQNFFYNTYKGKITSVHLLTGTPEAVGNTIKSLLSYFQISKPSGKEKIWTAREEDAYGHFNVEYAFVSADKATSTKIIKHKKNYITLKAELNTNELKTTYTTIGSTTITLDTKTGSLVALKGEEQITTKLAKKLLGVLKTKFQFDHYRHSNLKPGSSAKQLDKFSELRNLYYETKLYTFISSQDFNKLVRANTLETDNFETIIVKLRDSIDPKDEDSIYLKIRALATVHPETCKSLADILDMQKANTTVYNLLYRGLLGAENDESVNALSMILLKHRNDWEYEKNIVTNLGLSKVITDTLVNTYKELATASPPTKLNITALIALGTMVDNLSVTDSSASAALLQWVFSETSKLGNDIKPTRQKLLTWGNTNTKQALDSILPYLKYDDASINVLAATSVGLFTIPQAAPLLLDIIKNDTSREVRYTAADGLRSKITGKQQLLKVAQLFKNEKDTTVRTSLVNSFDVFTDHRQTLKAILHNMLKTEKCYTVKETVNAMLQKLEAIKES